MSRPSSLSLAEESIFAHFRTAQTKIYTTRDLAELLAANRRLWALSKSTSINDFILFLKKHGDLRAHSLTSEAYDRVLTRFSWKDASPLQIALSINRRGYFCHGTAAALHGLMHHNEAANYLNIEQSPKPESSSTLTQSALDLAFSRKQRQSKLHYDQGNGTTTIIVAGKSTACLGVEEVIGPNSERLKATNIPRTLIDMVVRPAYAGGAKQVLKAFRDAKTRVVVDEILAMLKRLDYAYPYHQSIGFLMQRAGYETASLNALRALGLNHNFYLTHGMKNPKFSPEWRIHYPKDL